MTTVYVSSTFNDLKDYREAVERSLRKSGVTVIAMEDYVASDERPLDRCLADVRSSDIYIGIFAHRYGFVPLENNPDHRSITELEYRQAVQAGKSCLIFLLNEDTPWLLKFTDVNTGDGDNGHRIRELRAELSDEFVISYFKSPDDLAALATAAVARYEAEHHPSPLAAPTIAQTNVPQARELQYQLFLTHLEPDTLIAEALPIQLELRSRSLLISPSALQAHNAEELIVLENGLRQCHIAAVILSEATIARLREQSQRSLQLLNLLRSRTGCLLALCLDRAALDQASAWGATHQLDMSVWQPGTDMPVILLDELDRLIAAQLPKANGQVVGLPFVIIAVKHQEAEELLANPTQVADPETRQALRQLLGLPNEDDSRSSSTNRPPFVAQLAGRYGTSREDWQPFGADNPTVSALISEFVSDLNGAHDPRLRGRSIKVQYYSFDPIMEKDESFHPLYRDLAQNGCILVVDELSLLHRKVGEALLSFPFFTDKQVSVVSISPINPYGSPLFKDLESKVSQRLSTAHYRFAKDYDPKCELSIGDDRRFKRWLHSSLPTVMQDLRVPIPDSVKLFSFAQELGREIDHQVAREYYSKGAGL
jgi:hypothetical protein